MKDVYIVDYIVKDCLGNNAVSNYINMPNSPGATDVIRYDPENFPNVLCKKGYHMDSVDNNYSTYNLAVDLCNELIHKYIDVIPKDSAVIFGSFTAGTKIRDEFVSAFNNGLTRFSPTRLFQGNHDLLSSLIAGKLKLEGINTSLNGACTSSMFNLHLAVMLIQTDQCSSAIVGNAEMPIEAKMQYHWQCTSAISTLNGGFCAPFDKSRDGFLQGEGGTIWFICDEDTLIKNKLIPKAKIRSIVSGAKVTSMTAHDKTCESQIKLIERALSQAQCNKQDISFLNAHATSTLIGDDIEFDVFQKVFIDNDLPIVSFKGYIGHTMSACGLIESAYGIEALKNGYLHPNNNLIDPLNSDPRILADTKKINGSLFMKTSFGFGGRTNITIFETLNG